jgi:hypothetical protein
MTKQKSIEHFITLNNKKYFYKFEKINTKKTFVECKAANISQEFLNEDIAELLIDLPNLILAEKKYQNKQDEIIRFRINSKDKKAIEKIALANGYNSISGFLRDVALSKLDKDTK